MAADEGVADADADADTEAEGAEAEGALLLSFSLDSRNNSSAKGQEKKNFRDVACEHDNKSSMSIEMATATNTIMEHATRTKQQTTTKQSKTTKHKQATHNK